MLLKSIFLDFDFSIYSNLTILFTFSLGFCFSLAFLSIKNKKILFLGKYLISLILIFPPSQHAEITCKSCGDCAIIFFKNFYPLRESFNSNSIFLSLCSIFS